MSKDSTKIEEHSDYKPADKNDDNVKHHLSGMYQNWFLDYASYGNVPFHISLMASNQYKDAFCIP